MPNDKSEYVPSAGVTRGEVFLGGVGAAMAGFTLPATEELGDFANKDLNDKLAEQIVSTLGDYKKQLRNVRSDFSDYARVATNFVDHVVKDLKNYRSVVTSWIRNYDAEKFENYKNKFKECFQDIMKDCDNSSIKSLTAGYYEQRKEKMKQRLTNSGGILIGDFAGRLRGCAENMIKKLENINPEPLMGLVYGEEPTKRGRFKQLLREKFSNSRKILKKPVTDIVEDLVSGATRGGLKPTGEALLGAVPLTPIEYFDFETKNVLSMSVIHSVMNILKSYSKTLKGYPGSLRDYVNDCNDYTKKLLSNLEKLESYLNIFSKSSISFDQKATAKAKIDALLGQMISFIENTILKNSYMEDLLKQTEGSQYGGYLVKRSENSGGKYRPYTIDGLTYAHFMNEFIGCVKKTKDELNKLINLKEDKIDYEALKIKAPKGKKGKASAVGSDAQSTAKESVSTEKEKANALKYYINALTQARDVHVEVEKSKSSAERIYKLLMKSDPACVQAFEKCYGGKFIESMEEEKEKKEWRKYSEGESNAEKHIPSVEANLEKTNGFIKLKAFYQLFQLGYYVVKKDGKDTETPCTTIDWMPPNKEKVNKENAKLVIEYNAQKGKLREFLEYILGKLTEFKRLGKEVKKEFDTFVKLYKNTASKQEKENKKAAKKAEAQEKKEAKNKKAEEEKRRKAAEKAAKTRE